MTTDIAPRTWMDDADQLPAEIPGAAALEPGRMNWYHGVDAGKIKTPGVFFARETAFIAAPESPWEADDRYGDKGEQGYAAPRLELLFIANRSQWFIPGENQGDLPQWIDGYQVGAKKLTEYLVLIRGLDEPMVLSVSGKYKAAPIEKILGDYRRGALTQAMRQHHRTLPAWAFALTIGGRTNGDGKPLYEKAKDSDGKEYGSIVTPPALLAAPKPATIEEIIYGSQVYKQHAEWRAYRRGHTQAVDAVYTVSAVPALPAGKNVPQPVEDDELF